MTTTTRTFSTLIAAPTLPESLPIPFLTWCSRITRKSQPSFDIEPSLAPACYTDTYSRVDFDYDGGEGDDWSMGIQMSTMNADYDYLQENLAYEGDELAEVVTSGYSDQRLDEYCREMSGVAADDAEPLQIYENQFFYLDWMDCIRYWRASMTEEQIERIDWSNLNPSRYSITSNKTLQLINSWYRWQSGISQDS